MKYRRFGKTDLKVSLIGIGAWQAGFRSWGKGYTREDVIDAYRYAFENGINFIDTAEVYGYGLSEEIVGEAIKGYEVIVATKLSGYNTSRKAIEKSIKNSLRRLGIESIDLYQIHWPPTIYSGICGVIKILEDMVDKGFIRYIGISNFPLKLLKKAIECASKYDIVSNQIQYNLVYRNAENELIPFMNKMRIELISYSPLAKGALAGSVKADSLAKRSSNVFRRGVKAYDLHKILTEISSKYGVSKATVSLAWIISKGAFPIPGVKRRKHIDDIVKAAEIKLGKDEMKVLDQASLRYIFGNETFQLIRFIPGPIQKIFIRLVRGL